MTPSTTPLDDFIATHGRFPRLGDTPAPYTYQGLLLRYVALCHHVIPEMKNRWGYHQYLMRCETLPPEPIPRITFEHAAHPDVTKALTNWVAIVEDHGHTWDGFRLFIDWLAYGLGVAQSPSTLPDKIQTKLYQTVQIHLLLQHPYDHLGEFLVSRKSPGHNPTAFFPTPHSVVELMTAITMHTTSEDLRLQTCCDPCCGTGRMLLHSSNYALRLYGVDLDPLVCKIAAINGALYAPWLAFPFPERLFPSTTPGSPLDAHEPPADLFAIHTHATYTAMTQTSFNFDVETPVQA